MFDIIMNPDVVNYWVKNRVKEITFKYLQKFKPFTKNKIVKFLEVASFIEYLEIYDGFESPHMIQPSYPFLDPRLQCLNASELLKKIDRASDHK